MEMAMEEKPESSALPSSVVSTVAYCCGACGYDLKLSSSARNTAGIVVAGGGGRGYRRRGGGVVRFDAIEEARFGHVDEFRLLRTQI
uniref:Uncharacterized protein n=1 Tax=Oryza brachyantha TaxID=4533 RepID=J3M3L7_ORYBR